MRDKGCTRVLLKCSNEIDYREKLDLVVRLLHVSEQALRVATSTARDFVSQPETWSVNAHSTYPSGHTQRSA